MFEQPPDTWEVTAHWIRRENDTWRCALRLIGS